MLMLESGNSFSFSKSLKYEFPPILYSYILNHRQYIDVCPRINIY